MEARLADLLAALSRIADLGFGLEPGSALRSCCLATRFARELDLSETEVRAAFYTSLMHHIGCLGFARETAALFGDDFAAYAAAARTDAAAPGDLWTTFLPALTRGRTRPEQVRLVLTALTRGQRWGDRFTTAACEVGRDSARRLGLPDDVQRAVFHVYDQWGGERRAAARAGEDIPVASRLARLAGIAVLFETLGGTELAVEAVRRRRGGMLDPQLAEEFAADAGEWLADLAVTDVRAVALAIEPRPHVTVPDVRAVAEVFGDVADLKSPYWLGHSRGVAALARGAGEHLGLPDRDLADLELAGLLHDVGRVAVSNAVWDKSAPLAPGEWEQVRLHAYHSERILAASTELERLVPLVGRHHERLDGTGYHRGSTRADLSVPARVLAAADRFRTLLEPRPHRAARTSDEAERLVLAEAEAGTLDGDAVHGVLAASGRPGSHGAHGTRAGLSEREVEVLGLVAHGLTNAEIAGRLVISRRTAEHHVQHIYTKIGCSGRAAATLFAVEHGLLGPDG